MSTAKDILLDPGMHLSQGALACLKQYGIQAFEVGPATGAYLLRMVADAKMEKRLLDGCKALLLLKKAYGADRLEAACQRGLKAGRCNYSIIRTILHNGIQDPVKSGDPVKVPLPPDRSEQPFRIEPNGSRGHQPPHENLRGASSFEI